MSHPVHLILSAGTRIVTRNDANRIGSRQLIRAGAVAVITDTPADAQRLDFVRAPAIVLPTNHPNEPSAKIQALAALP